jgi:hypothetical protein
MQNKKYSCNILQHPSSSHVLNFTHVNPLFQSLRLEEINPIALWMEF